MLLQKSLDENHPIDKDSHRLLRAVDVWRTLQFDGGVDVPHIVLVGAIDVIDEALEQP